MQIKVRMLLPKAESDAEEEDPRAELVRRLLEYKKYKEMAEAFGTYEQEQKHVYYRQYFAQDERAAVVEDLNETLLKNVSLFDLVAAFKRALDKAPQSPSIHTVRGNPRDNRRAVRIHPCRIIVASSIFVFRACQPHGENPHRQVTFLAMLELIRTKMIAIRRSIISKISLSISGDGFRHHPQILAMPKKKTTAEFPGRRQADHRGARVCVR